MSNSEHPYAEGFNNGYILAKYVPEIYATLGKGIEPKNDYLEGFISGGKEYEIEKNAPEKTATKEAKQKDKDIEHDR